MQIRLAKATDATNCLRIYGPIVRDTAISFEEAVPTTEEFATRISTTLERFPWLVCCDPSAPPDHSVVGYAYAGTHRDRAAYRWTTESAIYVDVNHQGKGIGHRLYAALFDILRMQGFQTVVAGATVPNASSVAIHERLGFKTIGVFQNVGFKFEKWHSTQWFELDLETNHAPREPIPLCELLRDEGAVKKFDAFRSKTRHR